MRQLFDSCFRYPTEIQCFEAWASSILVKLYSMISRLSEVDWLIDWCFTARQHKIGQFVPIYQGGLLVQAFEDRLANEEYKKNI